MKKLLVFYWLFSSLLQCCSKSERILPSIKQVINENEDESINKTARQQEQSEAFYRKIWSGTKCVVKYVVIGITIAGTAMLIWVIYGVRKVKTSEMNCSLVPSF